MTCRTKTITLAISLLYALTLTACLAGGFPIQAAPQWVALNPEIKAEANLPLALRTPFPPTSTTVVEARPSHPEIQVQALEPTAWISTPTATVYSPPAIKRPLPNGTLALPGEDEGSPTQTQITPAPTRSPNYNPLTGLQVHDPSTLERRPLAIKVTNFPRGVRPQWGLSLADIVFEYYMEHGMTRFLAIFYGNDAARVGPVRSARFFDEHLIRMYKSVFVFANADRKILDHLLETDLVDYFVVERPDNCPPLCRNQYRSGYNNLYADTRALTQYITERNVENDRPDLNGMHFTPEPPVGGLPGKNASVFYSTESYHRWEYIPELGRYFRYQETASISDTGESYDILSDRLTESPVVADNVVVLMVPHHYYSEDPEIVTMALWGFGSAYVFRDGNVYRVFWGRAEQESVLTLLRSDGSPFPLKPGVTFFQVLGYSSSTWQLGENWRFDFYIP